MARMFLEVGFSTKRATLEEGPKLVFVLTRSIQTNSSVR